MRTAESDAKLRKALAQLDPEEGIDLADMGRAILVYLRLWRDDLADFPDDCGGLVHALDCVIELTEEHTP